jgi:hypothetical protein
MVRHWKRVGGARSNIFVNGLGSVATGATTIVVLTAKFLDGAWVTVLLIPLMLTVMTWVRRHYRTTASEIDSDDPADFQNLQNPIVVIPIDRWSKIAQKALRFAYSMSREVRAVHVSAGDETHDEFCRDWARFADAPARQAGLPPPELVVIDSPFRLVLTPILDYVLELEKQNSSRQIAVLLPELVERHWYHYLLHNQRAEILKAWLLVKGSQRIVIVSVPWYLQD